MQSSFSDGCISMGIVALEGGLSSGVSLYGPLIVKNGVTVGTNQTILKVPRKQNTYTLSWSKLDQSSKTGSKEIRVNFQVEGRKHKPTTRKTTKQTLWEAYTNHCSLLKGQIFGVSVGRVCECANCALLNPQKMSSVNRNGFNWVDSESKVTRHPHYCWRLCA